MGLVNKKEAWNLKTLIAGGLSLMLVSFFIVTWRETSLFYLYIEGILTSIIFILTKNEIRQNQDQLIHGAIVSLTILPWVFYLLMSLINMLMIF